jgi:hypothetical protein
MLACTSGKSEHLFLDVTQTGGFHYTYAPEPAAPPRSSVADTNTTPNEPFAGSVRIFVLHYVISLSQLSALLFQKRGAINFGVIASVLSKNERSPLDSP